MKYVISLGYFDGLHLGHQALLNSLKYQAVKNNAIPLVITFGDDFFQSLGCNVKIIDLEKEKVKKIKNFGIKNIDVIKPASSFLQMSGNEFEDYLMTKYNICGLCIGEDFTYGHFASSSIKDLENFSIKRNLFLHVEPLISIIDQKVSSTVLRNLLKEGNIGKYETYAGSKYSIIGKVIHGRGEGRKYGFKTANLECNPIKIIPKSGVYLTETMIDHKTYKSLTHLGECPTFGKTEITLETMLLDFSANIYEKEISITFLKRIRDNIRFFSPNELRIQIEKDIEGIKELYD